MAKVIAALVILAFACVIRSPKFMPRFDPNKPLEIPISWDRKIEFGLATSRGIYINPDACSDWPKACEFVKWHERCHYLQGSLRESRASEDEADRCAVKRAEPAETMEYIAHLRGLIRQGFIEIGVHQSFPERVDTLLALLRERLPYNIRQVSFQGEPVANASKSRHKKVRR
jgi:hypothetical protein